MKHGGIAEIVRTGQFPGIVGTQTNFKTPFIDKGKTIDTWPKWEKAGFRPLEVNKIKSARRREKVKEKIKKIKNEGSAPLKTELT